MARILDADPFVLLLIRGRGERELLAELQRRNAARAAAEVVVPAPAASAAPDGEIAKDAFAAAGTLPPLPEPPPLPDRPGNGPVLASSVPPEGGVNPAALEILAADAAARAWRLLAAALAADHATTPPAAPLTQWQDAARLAATPKDTAMFARLADGCGQPAFALVAAARAWKQGGAAALHALEHSWNPPAGQLEKELAALRASWGRGPLPRLRAWRNRWTVEGQEAQLRYGRDGLWYPYRKERGNWWPAGQPGTDPTVVLGALLED